ncbi:MAG: glycosyltransferase family 39 protein [Anaerolineae bacterium]|nr:glycosyltransferase family 39 protein [Anaerolineae bacterium]
MRRHRHLYTALIILLLAGALRIVGLDRTGLEIDEAFSIQLAALSPAAIVRGTAADVHPPLYYLILHIWLLVVGNSVFAVRLLSALLGWLAVALVYTVGRHLSPVVGLLGAALLAISPPHLWYSQQARQYALLILLIVASTWLAWRWWSSATAREGAIPVWYVLATLAALYTHTFAIFLLAAQTAAGILLWQQRAGQERPGMLPRWIALQVLVLLGFAPWLPVLVDQALNHKASWIPDLSWPLVRSSWLFMLSGRDWVGHMGDHAVALLGLGLLFLALPSTGRRPWNGRLLAWIALWFALPILLAITISLFTPIYQNKQLLIVVPALVLLLAAGCLRPKSRLVQVLLAAALFASLALARYQQYIEPYHESWDEVAAYLDANALPGDLLYLNAASARLALDYYLESDLDVAGYPVDYQFSRGGWYGDIATASAVDARLVPLTAQHSRVWLLEFVPYFWDPQGFIQAWFHAHYPSAQQIQIRDLSLWLFAR